MARELTPAELEELFGVYAIDALDGDELVQVEAYLARSPVARVEVAQLQEVAAMLAHSGGAAPDGLWRRIEESLAADPPGLVVPMEPPRSNARRGRGMGVKVALGVAAATAAAALVTVVVVSDRMAEQGDRLDQVASSVEHDGMRRAAMGAMADPDARTVRLRADAGAGTATVVTLPSGSGFLMAEDVPRLAPGRTYQLWAMTGDAAAPGLVSAGVLGRDLEIAAFHAPESAHGFVVTDEAAPGAITPSDHRMLAGEYT
jgi:Anti-sigma-K factor rskA